MSFACRRHDFYPAGVTARLPGGRFIEAQRPEPAIAFGTTGRKGEKGAGAIYRFHRGELHRRHAGVTILNAICTGTVIRNAGLEC
jgi:hypothetical protein